MYDLGVGEREREVNKKPTPNTNCLWTAFQCNGPFSQTLFKHLRNIIYWMWPPLHKFRLCTDQSIQTRRLCRPCRQWLQLWWSCRCRWSIRTTIFSLFENWVNFTTTTAAEKLLQKSRRRSGGREDCRNSARRALTFAIHYSDFLSCLGLMMALPIDKDFVVPRLPSNQVPTIQSTYSFVYDDRQTERLLVGRVMVKVVKHRVVSHTYVIQWFPINPIIF